ncbi:hypothetical protein A2631_01275 [Candidatus Daviesbacteria bacterium RIFCSPHIGHO2_01_FULL_44_29]|uniref:SpoVT-AbrB domain-containing protein n=1 Tax=Candidatus Daviesbacteria bacterium RIFCSPHIGHO2_02_FULL_43_12 TaxID=1797776 RepID=A0A1F5KKT3_9BACT|nr:MAG: hypothetical protein A2631_01275 [Candidatus Daviesbacteria bacterium RIFCSPHIGHO2_01_FULL_44_29]OGE38904.1 MAG: hypothetical protein A3E86_04085 [Candidatus Daviesbacteria bacterium RIFCSPHIGHO2_12_FULL_47_45]OGE41523.1 MAG: hypothetical protein A3D25_00695 [Candidatus Daviesbacteria bacterium RIFCSPHIGHO2_02_FULL_43_12]OGE69805.1 MAG: hypothetical protein A3B55_05340 [Candidatus Daviesbacteria bacterium RIFCSPLOWO2_01_FULL_43_15]
MEQVTISPKYQIVIPKKLRAHSKNLIPGNTVNIKRVDADTYLVKVNSSDWVEKMSGMMSSWKNPIEKLERGRNEEEERLKSFEKTS